MRILIHIFTTVLFSTPFLLFGQPKPSVLPTEKQFIIQSTMNFDRDSGGYWDVQTNSGFFKKKQSIQVWNYDKERTQIFLLSNSSEDGYFEIYTSNVPTSRLSVDSINAKESSSIEIKDKNDRSNQRFLFQHLGNGRFKIFDRYGRVLCISGASTVNGCIVNASINQEVCGAEWILIDYQSKDRYIPKDESRSVSIKLNDALIKLITTGKEIEVKQYFQNVTTEELLSTDNGSIVKAFSALNTNDKVTHTIWILEEVKNRPLDIRRYVYSELGKVDYNKPTFLLKQLINNYFTNYTESEKSLLEKIASLQRKMNK